MRRKKNKAPTANHATILNPKRAVFISGGIDSALVATVTQKIIALRDASTAPISVFIDSPGGSVEAAEVIAGLLKTPDQRGRRCWVNTVVTGVACSAAADLLAQGDYISAYPHSYILFHGTRTQDEELTAEVAREHQKRLLSRNRTASLKLADTVFDRLLSNYFELLSEVNTKRQEFNDELQDFAPLVSDGALDVPAFVIALSERVEEPYKTGLTQCLHEACSFHSVSGLFLESAKAKKNLPAAIRKAISKRHTDHESATDLEKQIHLLSALIAQRIYDDPHWDLRIEDFSILEQYFRELSALAEGSSQDELLEQVLQHKQLLFSPEDHKFFRENTENDLDNPRVAERTGEIASRAEQKIKPLWSLAVTLCRTLQVGDNPVHPQDAWWLGLIDEVIGTPLARRQLSKGLQDRLRSQMPVSHFYSFDR